MSTSGAIPVVRLAHALDPSRDVRAESIALMVRLAPLVEGEELGVALYGLIDLLAVIISKAGATDELLRIVANHLGTAVAALRDDSEAA